MRQLTYFASRRVMVHQKFAIADKVSAHAYVNSIFSMTGDDIVFGVVNHVMTLAENLTQRVYFILR